MLVGLNPLFHMWVWFYWGIEEKLYGLYKWDKIIHGVYSTKADRSASILKISLPDFPAIFVILVHEEFVWDNFYCQKSCVWMSSWVTIDVLSRSCSYLSSFLLTIFCFVFRYAITLWYFDAIEREKACRRHKQECKYQVAPLYVCTLVLLNMCQWYWCR